jgi:NADPH:quinone reductase
MGSTEVDIIRNKVELIKERFTVQAIRVHTFGDVNQLRVDEVPLPEPQTGQVRVKVQATGVNFVEVYNRKGWYPQQLPITLGGEFAGAVDAVGQDVTNFQVGDRVVTANGQGGYAQFAIAPAARLVKIPADITFEEAAAVILQGMTAHFLARSTYPLKPGDTALIHAAAGGVGQLLVQIAKMSGARVIATVSTEEKANLARQAGADETIRYTEVDFEEEVKRLTNGLGVEVVYDGVGKTTFAKGLNVLKPRGYMVLFGQASGRVEPVDPQILNQKGSLFLTRPSMGHYLSTRTELLERAGDLFDWISAGKLKVRIDRSFPLSEAARAHTYLEERATKGKVLLIP